VADFIDGIVKRRGGAPADDAPAPKASYGAVKGDALGTLARILRVSKEDRGAFDAALADYIEACMEDEEKETPAEEDAEPADDTETPEE